MSDKSLENFLLAGETEEKIMNDGVCEKCGGEGILEGESISFDGEGMVQWERPCDCQADNYSDMSGATEGDR